MTMQESNKNELDKITKADNFSYLEMRKFPSLLFVQAFDMNGNIIYAADWNNNGTKKYYVERLENVH